MMARKRPARSPRRELDDIIETVVSLVGGLDVDFDEGRDSGAASEARDLLGRAVELLDTNEGSTGVRQLRKR